MTASFHSWLVPAGSWAEGGPASQGPARENSLSGSPLHPLNTLAAPRPSSAKPRFLLALPSFRPLAPGQVAGSRRCQELSSPLFTVWFPWWHNSFHTYLSLKCQKPTPFYQRMLLWRLIIEVKADLFFMSECFKQIPLSLNTEEHYRHFLISSLFHTWLLKNTSGF